ncbi:MAG: alkaline phosphatase D family protein [Emcibacteraceae bacterium]|nr:alkaline phosphatase D family protein [Emcibacteraceae bacterium]
MDKSKFAVTRRGILKTIPTGAALAISGCATNESNSGPVTVDFNHSIASGDPLQDRVIIWTRVSPHGDAIISVHWDVALDEKFENISKSGTFETDKDRDYTVKVDVTGLNAGTKYYYRFNVGDQKSPVGETKTLNSGGTEPINLAVVSCSNYPWGYFNGYRAISEMNDIDVVLHLGDYIYEYRQGGYDSPNAEKMGRLVDPPHEIISLSDYRLRYAQYRMDEDLQALHQKFPFICAWDDHEFSNNAYIDGALNHDENEDGEWEPRKRAAAKAFMEWLPVRVTINELPTVRSFDFGKLATLAMLDTRAVGRERPLEYENDVELNDQQQPDYAAFHKRLETEERSLIGSAQEKWLEDTLIKSNKDGIPWQILGQQVIMSYRPEPALSHVFTPEEISKFSAGEQLSMKVAEEQGGFYNPDAWDGYQPARRRVFDMLEKHAENPIVLTGDTHCGWAMSLTDKMGGKHYGAEFAVQGITSPNRGRRIGKVAEVEQAYYDHMDHMAYANIMDRGYMTMTITEEETTTHWHVVSTVESKDFDVTVRKSLKYTAGDSADGQVTLEDVT